MELSLSSMLREARSGEKNQIASVKVRFLLADNYREPTSSKFGPLVRWFIAPDSQSHLLANWVVSRESYTKRKTIDAAKFRTPRFVCACARLCVLLLSAYRAPLSHLSLVI